jgi:hypothetical protein
MESKGDFSLDKQHSVFWPSTKPCEGRSIGACHLKFLGPPHNEQEHDMGGGEAALPWGVA